MSNEKIEVLRETRSNYASRLLTKAMSAKKKGTSVDVLERPDVMTSNVTQAASAVAVAERN